jgi:hypothetical protein
MANFYDQSGYAQEPVMETDCVSILSRATLYDQRDNIQLSHANDLFRCVYSRCDQGGQIHPGDTVDLSTTDTPLDPDAPMGVMVWHIGCKARYRSDEQLRNAANRIKLPVEIVQAEQTAGRDAVEFIALKAQSALKVAVVYEGCPTLTVNYAGRDEEKGVSWVMSIPTEALSKVPVDASVFNKKTFGGLFRMRAVVKVSATNKRSPELVNKTLLTAVKEAMETSLSREQRQRFQISEKERMDVYGDMLNVAAFRHPQPDASDATHQFMKVVIELEISLEKLIPLLTMFSQAFLDPDGDVQRSTNRLMWSEVFDTTAPREVKEVTLPNGQNVPIGKNGNRQMQNRHSWMIKWTERRNFLKEAMDTIVQRMTERFRSTGTIQRTERASEFCNFWKADIKEVEQGNETSKWEYFVNAQAEATFQGMKDTDLLYVVTEDMTKLQCYRNDSAENKNELFTYFPSVCFGDPTEMQRDMSQRQFVPVYETEALLIYRQSVKK